MAALVLGLGVVGILVLQNQPSAVLAAPAVTTPPSLEHGRDLGSPTAPVKVDVWSDFQCPYCLEYWTDVEPNIVSTFIASGKVELIYHDYTFIGPESLAAAVAARCADQQGRFWEYHDLLYANQGKENSGAFSSDRLARLASLAGLDVGTWTTCLANPSIAAADQAETAQGAKLGVQGTPTLFVNGKEVQGFDFLAVSTAIEGALGTPAPGTTSTPGGTPGPSSGTSASATPTSATP